MTINETGLTRRVVILDHVVVKIARRDDGIRLKDDHGKRANLTEARLSPLHPDILCPVLWSAKDGSVLIMRKADPISIDHFSQIDVISFRRGLPIERKHSSFGILDGRVVAIDYGG